MPKPARPSAADGRHSTRPGERGGFVGRSGDIELLRDLLSEVSRGAGGVLVVSGEQGIGKSALLREGLASAVRLGCRVGWGVADELRQGFPLGVIVECLGSEGRLAVAGRAVAGRARAGGGWGLGGPLSGDPVQAGVERLLTAAGRLCAVSPVVLVAEDLQWADETSLLVWRRLSRAAAKLPLLVVGSLRPVPARPEVERLVLGVAAAGGVVLELGPLAHADVTELASGLVGGVPGRRLAGVLGRAGGNPLYLAELAGALVRQGRVRVVGGVAELTGEPEAVQVPGSLAAAIGERLAGLAPAGMGVLRWAALLGPEFTVTDLAVVTGWSAGELAEVVEAALAAGVVEERVAGELAAQAGGWLGFRHGLIRQALYEQIPVSVRDALHVQAARALARAGAPAERVAAQLAAAPEVGGDWAWQWLADAAGTLAHRTPQVAAQLLRRALACLPETDHRREVLETGLVTAAFMLTEQEELERIARPLLERTADADRAAEVSWLLGIALARAGRPAEGALIADMALARPYVSQLWQARLRACQAIGLAETAEADRAAEVARQALAGAERTGDQLAAGYALRAMSCMAHRQLEPGLEHIERALEMTGEDPRAADVRLLLLSSRAGALGLLDRHAEAEHAFQETLALAAQMGTPQLILVCSAAAEYYYDAARWDDALAMLDADAGHPGPDHLSLRMHGLAALIAGHRDDSETAEKHLAAVRHELTDSPRVRAKVHYLYLARAVDAERAGRLDEAARELARILDPAIAADMPELYTLFPALTRLALSVGDTPAAESAAAAAAQEAQRAPLPVRQACADLCRGLAKGDPEPVLAAAAYYESAGRPFDRAQALEDAAVLLAERGGRSDLTVSRHAFRDAARLYLGLGAKWDLQRADARLRPYDVSRLGGRRRASTGQGWDALTRTEVKVADLVGAGQTNPQIAAELFLSRNTVQTHVSHILAKLGAHSRAEIIRQLAERTGASRPEAPQEP